MRVTESVVFVCARAVYQWFFEVLCFASFFSERTALLSQYVAQVLQAAGISTFLCDLLTQKVEL